VCLLTCAATSTANSSFHTDAPLLIKKNKSVPFEKKNLEKNFRNFLKKKNFSDFFFFDFFFSIFFGGFFLAGFSVYFYACLMKTRLRGDCWGLVKRPVEIFSAVGVLVFFA
jgi:hypothetical protein